MSPTAVECWSGRPSTDEDTVLMKTQNSSTAILPPTKKHHHRLLAAIKSSLNLDPAVTARLSKLRSIIHRGPTRPTVVVVSVDEQQTVRSGREEMGRWLLSPNKVELAGRAAHNSFRGLHQGRKVWIKLLRGCECGSAYAVEVRRDLLQLMSCGHRNILQLHGVCIEGTRGLCIVTRMMVGGSVHELMQKKRKVPAVRIALDIATALWFMNQKGVAYRDLSVKRILLDRQGNACLGDMGVVVPSHSNTTGQEVREYETSGYRWLAPEIIAGDPENVTETWMSNVYSFGMVVWEMVTGEAAYSSYSPVQAAVGIAACGLRPEIPKDCPQLLRSLMLRCWNNCPSERPQFPEIISILQRLKQ